ncbi:MAG: ABC transporter ATP-binding protein [Acutalibacteraceae bacterium]
MEKLVSYGRTPYHTMGLSPNVKKDEEKVNWAMEITDTLKHKHKAVSQLSGGQKQRVWIAMALAQDTKILFLDEPTTYLDIRYQLQILKLIRQLNQEYNLTIVMVLHDINQSLYYSDEIIAMKDGKIIAQGLPEDIITPELVKSVFDVELNISTENGKPFILPI